MMIHSRISGDIHHKGRLTHGRTGGDDDKVGRLPSESYLVEGRETGRHSAQAGGLLQFLYGGYRLIYDRTYLLDVFLDIVLDGSEDSGLSHVDELVHVHAVII